MKRTGTRYYMEFSDEMILRDYLAFDRTVLANNRTLLAYARTFLGLIAGGIGMVKLVADEITKIIGYAFIFCAIPIMIIGIVEFIRMKRFLSELIKKRGA